MSQEALALAWKEFLFHRPWELIPAEISLPVKWRRLGSMPQDSCIGLMGHGSEPPGLTFYEEHAAFDGLWSGTPSPFDGISVLLPGQLDAQPWLSPQVIRVEKLEPREARVEDVDLAVACLQLIVSLVQGGLGPVLYAGGSLEAVRP